MLNKNIKILTMLIGLGIGFSSINAYAVPDEQTIPTKTTVKAGNADITMKSKGNFFKVKTNSVYHFLTTKSGENGYKLIWDIGAVNDKYDDNRLILSDNETLIDSVGIAVNNLNYLVGGSANNLNLVFGFICPNKKEVVITYSRNAKLVVDKDGYMCKMITPIKFIDNSNTGLENRSNIIEPPVNDTTYSSGVNYTNDNSDNNAVKGQKVKLKRDLESLKTNNYKQAEPYIMNK